VLPTRTLTLNLSRRDEGVNEPEMSNKEGNEVCGIYRY